ncbi:MAG: type I restriction endonuclease subunit R [Firmicutes bacterium]|nr:type I restriction endonuclease subunit R [Bacillota bacterium]
MAELGWETHYARREFEHGASPLGRETKSEVVLIVRLRETLGRLNPDAPAEAIGQAVDELTRDRSRMSLVAANREIHELIKNGFRACVPDSDQGEQIELVRIIDWENPLNNDFLLCSQFWVTGEMYTRRADLVGFVNGLPLLFIELKAAHRQIETAYTGNLTDYKDTIPHLLWYNVLIILSNGSLSRIGSVTAGWEHFAEWKRVGSETEEGRISLETMLRGTCDPVRFLDLVENFTLFMNVPRGQIKLITKNHQYLGVNNAIEALDEIDERQGRLGVFWHTQGSGKSISMIFFSQKVLRKLSGNWSFVVVTDRKDLDEQIYNNFVSTGVVTEGKAQADSSRHLRRLLREDHRYIFTLIQKFRTGPGEEHPVLSERKDIIVITDEAHRSQYDTLALNMRTALPHASFIAFTGTPLIEGEEKTRQVFGDYISIYDFHQSAEDKATVPLYYENRIPELQLTNERLNEEMADLLDAAELDEAQEEKLEREFAREYHLITRDDRLEAVSADIVEHFINRGFQGKAMVICIDKATAVRMYDKVKRYWAEKTGELRSNLAEADGDERKKIAEKIRLLEETDMAVIVSQAQNEIRDMEQKGLDIRPHRKRMVEEDMDNKFKDPADPFRLVFVCAMWMTGFDVPSCSTLYLDKPMRNHTLMQTIARANRVYQDKVSGLIVDYVGVFRNLEKALAIYGAAGAAAGGKSPIKAKKELLIALKHALEETKELCRKRGVELERITEAQGFDRIALLDDAVDALVASDEQKKRFLDHANNVTRLYKAILPDPAGKELQADCTLIRVLADKIRSLNPPVDISEVMGQVEGLLDRSIAAKGYVIRDDHPLIDLSRIDFEKLRARFEKGRKHTEVERIKAAVTRHLQKLVRLNRSRMDYLERFQQMIDEYNSGSLNVEEFFHRLMEFAKNLTDEEQRAVKEELSEEELAIFDLLTKPEIELTRSERSQVKRTARELLEVLKREKLILDWRKRQQARAQVRVTIEQVLDEGLPEAYTPEIYDLKTAMVFEHVYESYYGDGKSIYTGAA